MRYWQNEETGMCCATEERPSMHHIEITIDFYNLHENELTSDVRISQVELDNEKKGFINGARSKQ